MCVSRQEFLLKPSGVRLSLDSLDIIELHFAAGMSLPVIHFLVLNAFAS